MSLAEILDAGAPHPWANIRVQDIVADGSFTISGGISIAGDLDVTGGNLNVTPGEIRTNIIQPAVPNADLIVQANGIQVFDIQTSLARANNFQTDSIDSKTPGGNLQIGGANALFIQVNDNIFPDLDNTRFIGNNALRFAQIHGAVVNADSLDSSSAVTITLQKDIIPNVDATLNLGSPVMNFLNVNAHNILSNGIFDLQLQGGSGLVSIPTGNELRVNIIHSQAAQPLDIISDGPTDVSITSGSGLIQVGASALNGNSFLLSSGANQFSPKVDNAFDLGTALLAFRNEYLYNLILNANLNMAKTALVTQITSLVTGVISDGIAGSIATVSSTLAANTSATFTVTNANCLATNFVQLQLISYSGTQGGLVLMVSNILAGSFDITVRNTDAALAQDGVITFSYHLF